MPTGQATPGWRDLPLAARLYVSSVIVAGGATLAVFFPRQIRDPVLFTGLRCRVAHVGVEGNAPASDRQRVDAVGVMRGQPDGAVAARPVAVADPIAVAAFWIQCASP